MPAVVSAAPVPQTWWQEWRKVLSHAAGGVVFLTALYLVSLHSYLLFHACAEVFSIAVAIGIFMVAWNSRAFHEQSYFLFLGVAFLCVGILDLMHMLAYRGMGVFPESDGNLSTQLWVLARLVHAVSFVAAPLFLKRRIRSIWMFICFGLALAASLTVTLGCEVFPVCYVQDQGLTRFKIVTEYLISGLFLGALGLHWRRQTDFDRSVLRWIMASLSVTAASELAFTLYVDVYGRANFIGHVLKVAAFYLIYRAFVQMALTKPYQLLFLDLKRTQAQMESAQQHLQVVNRDLENSLRLLADDETAARRIQFLLLPPRRLVCGRWEFQSTIRTSAFLSGDFVDYFPITPEWTGFYIADVSGHGVSSAFITVLLKSTMGHLLEQYQQGQDEIILHPEQVLSVLNQYLAGQRFGKYLTMFYGILDARQGSLRFSNGGHFPNPMLVDEHGSRLLVQRALPVGLCEDAVFAAREEPLGARFHLALFSDGVLDLLPQLHLQEKQAFLLAQIGPDDVTLEQLEERLGLNEVKSPSDDLTVCLLKEAA